jgi:hypothetical protein
MEKVFLSYTYRPHPHDEANLNRLRGYVIRAIEAMGLRIIDGVDVGGRPLDDALKKRIEDADALIALVTPQADGAGNVVEPAFVLSEFQYAEGQKKPTMRVWHPLIVPRGLGAGNEYTHYTPDTPGSELHVILKLMNTIALWRRDYSRAVRVRIEPDDLAVRYDETQGDRCDFQVISLTGSWGEFERAKVWQDPGATYAHLKLREGERVRLRLRKAGRTWESGFFDPFVGGVRLEPVP